MKSLLSYMELMVATGMALPGKQSAKEGQDRHTKKSNSFCLRPSGESEQALVFAWAV